MKRRTKELLAQLKELSSDAKTNVFERIGLVDAILKDHDWIAEAHGGDELKAKDSLQDEHFHELNGVFTLGVLLAIYAAFPDEQTWREHKYNLAAMRAMWQEQRVTDREPRPTNRIKRADYEDLVKDRDKVERQLNNVTEVAETRESRIRALEQENAELRRENAEMRGRITELERMLDRQLATA